VPRGSISGIIDFGDATIGDPALDFCFFWAYGDWVVPALYSRYTGRRDRGLLQRSRWHYCRYLIDRLFYAVRERDRREEASVLGALRRELAWTAGQADSRRSLI
jgi:aminoglycoside phosphotransferase (APT) family kinase protein